MSTSNLQEIIISRIDKLERAVFGAGGKFTKEPNKTLRVPKTLSDHIIGLREGGFFKEPRTAHETHKKLLNSYPCESSRVSVELLRLTNRRELRKTSKEVEAKKFIAYVR